MTHLARAERTVGAVAVRPCLGLLAHAHHLLLVGVELELHRSQVGQADAIARDVVAERLRGIGVKSAERTAART